MAVRSDLIDILNSCIDRLNTGEAVEDVLQDYPDVAGQLRPMLEAGLLSRRVAFPIVDVDAARLQAEPTIQTAIKTTFGSGFLGSGLGLLMLIVIVGAVLTSIVIFNLNNNPTQVDLPTETIPVTEPVLSSIQFEGIVTVIEANQILVNSLQVDISDAAVEGNLVIGVTVAVSGQLLDGIVIAEMVTVLATPEATTESSEQVQVTVIEGPVSTINENIITIYGVDLEVPSDDPRLNVLQVGDVIRVEGTTDTVTVNILVINITFINVDVFVQGNQIWRDSGNCQNPPPAWAVANGWRQRCQGGGGNNGNSNGNSNGRDNDSDDDDD